MLLLINPSLSSQYKLALYSMKATPKDVAKMLLTSMKSTINTCCFQLSSG